MTVLTTLAFSLAALLAFVAAAFLIVGPARIWRLFGPSDLGDVAMENFKRRRTPNDALASPEAYGTANSDLVSPSFKGSARDLRALFATVIATEANIMQVAADDTVLTDRYVQRSERMHYADTIIVRFLDRPAGQSTVAIYSRSQLGRRDFGVNRLRVERWLEKLAKVPGVQCV